MASYKQEKNKTWSVRYRAVEFNNTIEKRKRGFKSKKDAEFWYSQILLKEKANENKDKMTVNQLFSLYKDDISQRLKTSSIKSNCDVISLFILPYFANKKINKLTPQDIREWKATINNKGYKYKYKSRMYAAFSALLNFAKKYYNLQSNVVNICGNFVNTERKKEMSFWTESEFKKVIEQVDEFQYKVFFSFLYLTGTRKGEALALTWKDINFDSGIINITKSVNRKGLTAGKTFEITTPKNKASYRDILMPNGLKTLLMTYKEDCRELDGFSENSFVFGNAVPFSETTVRRKLDEYSAKANVKHIRIHDLRHSHASLLINRGQNILIVSQRLGHSDITQTLNTYGHLFPSKQKEIIDAINIDF